MKKILIALVVTSLFACSKEDDLAIQPATPYIFNYLPMKVGNYWIYSRYDVYPDGREEKYPLLDSLYISKKTSWKNNTYYQFEGSYLYTSQNAGSIIWLLRDSSGYIVDTSGRIHFSYATLNDTLEYFVSAFKEDTIFTIVLHMNIPSQPIYVPAGSFKGICAQSDIDIYENHLQPGVQNPRTHYSFWSNNVGILKDQTSFGSSNNRIEIRLERFHVDP